MTSNIGSQFLLEGVTADGWITDEARTAVMNELREFLRPEFLNRIDETVLFKPLTLPELEKIVELMLGDLRKRLADRGLTLEVTEQARRFMASAGFDPVFGARPLRRYLQRELETRIGRALLKGDIREGTTIVVDVEAGEITVTWRQPAEQEVKTGV
jgi:ATP-dependent Clp protease ATP-binding subunit ClpB